MTLQKNIRYQVLNNSVYANIPRMLDTWNNSTLFVDMMPRVPSFSGIRPKIVLICAHTPLFA